jgi:hypothetical protein
MKQLLKYNPKFLINIIYIGVMSLMCLGILLFILKIQTQYAGDLINLRFNVYEGITVIDSAKYVWQYLIYAILFSILNGLGIWYVQKKFSNPMIQNTVIYWISGSSIIAISLLGIYLWLVLSLNS